LTCTFSSARIGIALRRSTVYKRNPNRSGPSPPPVASFLGIQVNLERKKERKKYRLPANQPFLDRIRRQSSFPSSPVQPTRSPSTRAPTSAGSPLPALLLSEPSKDQRDSLYILPRNKSFFVFLDTPQSRPRTFTSPPCFQFDSTFFLLFLTSGVHLLSSRSPIHWIFQKGQSVSFPLIQLGSLLLERPILPRGDRGHLHLLDHVQNRRVRPEQLLQVPQGKLRVL